MKEIIGKESTDTVASAREFLRVQLVFHTNGVGEERSEQGGKFWLYITLSPFHPSVRQKPTARYTNMQSTCKLSLILSQEVAIISSQV